MAARIDFRSLRHARGNAAPKIIAAIVILAAIGAGVWYFVLRKPEAAIPDAAVPTAETGQAADGAAPAPVTPDPAVLDKLNTLTVDQLFKEARTALNEQRLVSPPGNNALEFYLKILERDPTNSGARDALRELFTFAASAAEQDINARNIDNANRVIELLTKADPNNYTLTILRSKLDAQRKTLDQQQQQALDQQKAAALAAQKAAADKAAAEQLAQQQAAQAAQQQAAQTTQAKPAPGTAPSSNNASAETAAAAPTGQTSEAVLVKAIAPHYPPSAVRARQQGWVVVAFQIDADGTTSDIKVVDSEPRRIFDRAAMEAVARYQFTPAMRNGVPVASQRTQRIEFKL